MAISLPAAPCDAMAALEKALACVDGGARFDAMIPDYKMPGMNGLELDRQIRARMGPVATPPMILFTSINLASRGFMTTAREAGFTALLGKPAKSAQLPQALTRALGSEPRPKVGGDPGDLRDLVDDFLEGAPQLARSIATRRPPMTGTRGGSRPIS